MPETPETLADAAAEVEAALWARTGEGSPRPRLDATRRAVEILGDPQRAYPVIQLTGTNGKTSTARLIESILRAHGLRTGLFTSPHLRRFTERITIDGEPISDAAFVENWRDVEPYILMVDAELEAKGEPRLTFFETLTVLAFAAFADAPVDVAVVEVGMGGEWDSTNVADAEIAVFTPIDIDHAATLGRTRAEIARTKAGIIKDGTRVVSAVQAADALAELERRADERGAEIRLEDRDFLLVSDLVAVGGQQIDVRGRAGEYAELYLPLYGDHQGHNAAVAIAAVETFLGDGHRAIDADILAQGVAEASSPGRLQLIGTEPTVIVDAAHNPHGARALAAAIERYFAAEEIVLVLGALADKDLDGILDALLPAVTRVHAVTTSSDRALSADSIAATITARGEGERVAPFDELEDALLAAREWASESEGRMVLVAGSVILAGEAADMAEDREWK